VQYHDSGVGTFSLWISVNNGLPPRACRMLKILATANFSDTHVDL